VYEDNKSIIFDFSRTKILPPIELASLGMTIDREYLLDELPELIKDPKLTHLAFYPLVKSGALVGFVKDDPILHYSVAELGKYLKKIKTRVLNNVYKLEMSKAGFTGRSVHYPFWFRLKKYLFIPYSFSFLFPFIDGLYLSITRREPIFLAYPFLCFYISGLTIYYFLMKMLGVKHIQKGYGV
jgi:hypothetical protein